MVSLPNKITLARILAIPLFIVALYLPVPYSGLIAAAVFTVIALTDMADGWIARKRNLKSESGAILDPLADKLLVSAALIFLIGRGVEPWMAYVIIAREFLVTGLRLLAKNKAILSASWLGKIKTITQIVAVVAVLVQAPHADGLMLIATIITVVSGLEYAWRAKSAISL